MVVDLRDAVDVPAAAGRLGVSRAEARRLIRGERLFARQLAGRWVVPEVELRRFASLDRPVGRPLAPRSVWALIRMIDDLDARPEGMSPPRWSQLKRLLRDSDPQHLAAMARNRAQRRLYWIHPSLEQRLLADRRVHPSGWSALAELDVGLAVGDDVPIEMYCWEDDLAAVVQAHHLEPADAVANVVAHVISVEVPRGDVDWAEAVRPVSALDLVESGDPRARSVGLELWERVLESVQDG